MSYTCCDSIIFFQFIDPASERSELAGAEERRCGPLVGLLGSGEDASGRAHLPPPPLQTIRNVWLTAEQAA